MLSAFIIPALLGLGLIFNTSDSDDAAEAVDSPDTPEPDDLPTTRMSAGDDLFIGSDDAERAIGNAEANEMLTFAGNDVVMGEGGNDVIHGGAGDDTLYGGAQDDLVLGGGDDDHIYFADGNDASASTGDRYFDAGDDFIRGGAGDDILVDSMGENTLRGDTGNDRLAAIDGLQDTGTIGPAEELGTPDTLHGGYGNDTLIGDDGDDMTGGEGAEDFMVARDLSRTQEVLIINDFNVEEDALQVVSIGPRFEDSAMQFEFDAEESLVRAYIDGVAVAHLHGLTEAQIPDIHIAIIT